MKRWLENLYGVLVRSRRDITVGAGTSVSWFRLRGRSGTIVIGSGSIVRARIDFDRPDGLVRIGDRCFVGASHLVCHSRIELGNDVILSWGITIVDHDSHSLDWMHRKKDVADWAEGRKGWEGIRTGPVRIGDRVWIGFGATVLRGVTVGEGSVIGAQAVVTKDVEPYVVVAGNPARVVRRLNREQGAPAPIDGGTR